jgi:enamine deaminase RidA (YjgF/YER057c/UK114 family)
MAKCERGVIVIQGQPQRSRVSTGNLYEVSVGYSRATRVGERVFVSGTTALNSAGEIVGGDDVYLQTRATLETIRWALEQCGATMEDVVRYRVYLVDRAHIPDAARAMAEAFRHVRPSNTLVIVAGLADPRMLVEIDADAIIGSATPIVE